jgi:hypothetical protein
MLRRTFMTLAGGIGILSNTQTTTAETTTSSNSYDIYPDDDDATIQAALDDMSVVEAAPGDYCLSRDLVIPNHTTLRGAGEHRTAFHAEGPYQFENEDRPTTDITVERLTIDGHNHGANGLKLASCHDVTVRDVTVRNCGTRDSSESNAGGIHARVNLDDDAGDILVERVTAENCSAVSIDCGGSAQSAGPVMVRDCEVRYPNRSNRFTHGISVESVAGASVKRCRLVENDGAQLGINVNYCRDTVVEDCEVVGWKNAVHNYNARHEADVTVQGCTFRGLEGVGFKVQPAGDDSYRNEIADCRIDGCDIAIQGRHGGAVDVYDCDIRDARKAIKMNDITTAVTVRDVDVRDGRAENERTVQIKGEPDPSRDQYSYIANVFVDVTSGYMVVGMPGGVTSSTILGSWGEVGSGGSLKMATNRAYVSGNTLGGHLKNADNCITRDNVTGVRARDDDHPEDGCTTNEVGQQNK